MKNKVFDAITAKKIIGEYAEKINIYMRENQNLKNQIEDLKITLKINKDLLFKYISTNVQQTEQLHLLNEYKDDNLRLLEKNDKLYNEKISLEKKVYKIQQEVEESTLKLREELEQTRDNLFIAQNKLSEKEAYVSVIKKDLNNKKNFKTPSKEIYITEPTKANIDLNNELEYTRELIGKVSKLLNAEKLKNDKLELKTTNLTHQLESIKQRDKKSDVNSISEANNSQILNNKNNSKEENTVIYNEITSDIDINSLLSEKESNSLHNGDQILESSDVKFPDKVNYNSNSSNCHHKKNSISVPKLDFKIIKSKYESENMKPTLNLNPNKKTNTAEDKILKENEKLKIELRVAQTSIKELKSKLEKIKTVYKDIKLKLTIANETVLSQNSRVELLEKQIKKMALGSPYTDEFSSNKRNENSSTNVHTGRSHSENEANENKN